MAKKLNKDKRKTLLALVSEAAYQQRTADERRARIQALARDVMRGCHSFYHGTPY